jgi:hypothetical protein
MEMWTVFVQNTIHGKAKQKPLHKIKNKEKMDKQDFQ